MNHDEAKEILSAYRPNSGDAQDPVFAEALDLARRDPELGAWFARQQEFDAKMTGALREVRVPADLQESLRAAQKVAKFPVPWRAASWLAALAACVVIGTVVFFTGRENRIPASVFASEMAPLVDRHAHALESSPSHAEEARRWFAENGAPSDFTMPRGLLAAGGMACEVVTINGARVSLVCFPNGRGGVAHLYVIDRNRIAGAPVAGPAFHMEGQVAVAMWSDGRHTYLLAERGDIESLKAIF